MARDPLKMRKAIQDTIKILIDRLMKNMLISEPFSADRLRAEAHLYTKLVPEEIVIGADFERRFVTLFGTVWQDLAAAAANHGLGIGRKECTITGTIKSGRLRRIAETLNRLEHPAAGKARMRPDWHRELAYVLQGKGTPFPVQVHCDLVAENTATREKFAFDLKTPLANSDQSKVSKEKIFKLYAMEPQQVAGAFYALPYNPYDTRRNAERNFPARWFDVRKDEVVLIGDEFWEKLGSLETYRAFVDAVHEIGPAYQDRIYRDILGIEPPQTSAGSSR